MKREAIAANTEVDLLEIQDAFEKLGAKLPAIAWADAVRKLGPVHGMTNPDGKAKTKTAANFLKLCRAEFRRSQQVARKKGPGSRRRAGKSARKTA